MVVSIHLPNSARKFSSHRSSPPGRRTYTLSDFEGVTIWLQWRVMGGMHDAEFDGRAAQEFPRPIDVDITYTEKSMSDLRRILVGQDSDTFARMDGETGGTHLVRSPHNRWRRLRTRRATLTSPPVKSFRGKDGITQVSRQLPDA